MTLEKEIIDELIKRGWEQLKDRTYDKTALLETTIQLTQSKIIQIIDKRVEELKNPTIICPKCKFKGKDKDYNYDADAFETTCPKCGEEVYFPENRREIEELQSLKKSLLGEKDG